MNLTRDEIDLLDRHQKGLLTPEESASLQNRLSGEERFRKEAEYYFTLTGALKNYKIRTELKSVFDQAHTEMTKSTSSPENQIRFNPFRKDRWTLATIAASVALISVVSTLLITNSWNQEQADKYRELRRNVEQIKKSQNLIMKDIQKEKSEKAKESFAGTGFLISSGYISTSYHVIKEADSIYVENEKFGSKKSTVVYSDPLTDVAILKIEMTAKEQGLPPYSLSSKEASLAEEVFTLGYPREDVVFGSGTISASTGYQGNPNTYQISVPVNPGNSGGPLFNNKGDLIGIISGKQNELTGAAFATKSTKLLEILSYAPDSIREPLLKYRRSTQTVSSRVSQVNQWRSYVFIVKVYKN